jgi:tripartite ATP-independent transporter DctM subunit
LLLFFLVIGGLYSGIFTATESASVGVVGAFVYALVRGKLDGRGFRELMAEATVTIGMIYILIIGAITFSFFVGASGMPDRMTAWVSGLQVQPLGLIAIILLVYLVLGCVMDSFGVLIITTPIIAPLVAQSGYDLVWWGIVMVVVIETGMITPPFGLNIFMLKSIADAPLTTIYRGCIPFVIADLVKLAVMVLVPATVLWLPSTMFR